MRLLALLFRLGRHLVLLTSILLSLTVPTSLLAQDDTGSSGRRLIEDVTPHQVKRFLDPTRMISKVSYNYIMNYLPADIELQTHRLRPWVAVNNSNALWVEIPFLDYSIPERSGPTGMGDIVAGWGFILHENLESRLTTIAGGVEVLFPTGDSQQGTGFDKYAISPAIAVALNPTNVFPVYITGRYLQSVGDAQGSDPAASGTDQKLQTFELSIQTFHILPRGFFLAVLPTFFWDLDSDFSIFSLGVGAGRALNRRLALQAGYVQHVAGRETFNRGFTVGLTYLWGTSKSR